MTPLFLRRLTIAVIAIIVVACAVLIAVRIPRTLAIFLIASFIAFGASPLVRRMERRGVPRALAIALMYLVMIGGLVLLVLVIVPVSYGQLIALVNHAGEYITASQDAASRLEHFLRLQFGSRVELPTTVQLESEVGARVETLFALTMTSVGAIVVNTLNALLISASALILSVFFLVRGAEVRRGFLNLVPPSRRVETSAVLDEVASIFGHFVAGEIALSVVVGIVVWVALLPAHFAFALLVAVVCALGYAVPFVGMIVAQTIAACLAVPQGVGMVIYVTIAIFVVARLADNLLVPKLMGDAVGVSPIGIMFAIFAGGELFGVAGLVLAIPAAALVRVLFTHFVQPWILRMQVADVGIPENDLESAEAPLPRAEEVLEPIPVSP